VTAAVESLLKLVIVRIATGGGGGTGFFVAPDTVLTCAHVVNVNPGDAVSVFWGDRVLRGKVTARYPGETPSHGPFPYPDLAVIEVPAGTGNLCAALDTGFPELDTRLHSRGFTTTWSPLPTEEPSTFTYEGRQETGNGALLKLSSGEAVPGMSGSPLLDLTRGVVCGVLKTSRALGTDRGGWGVPARAVAEFLPEVIKANRDYQVADSKWAEAMRLVQPPEADGLTLDIGSITEVSISGRPARVLFTLTNSSAARAKVPQITLELLAAERLIEPHFFRPEGLPQYYDLEAHLKPDQSSYELLDLDHVLEPGETEGYTLRVTADEGWRYRLRLRVAWWLLGREDKHVLEGEPFQLSFRIMSTDGLLKAARLARGDADELT
jgi:hypothetical protein